MKPLACENSIGSVDQVLLTYNGMPVLTRSKLKNRNVRVKKEPKVSQKLHAKRINDRGTASVEQVNARENTVKRKKKVRRTKMNFLRTLVNL